MANISSSKCVEFRLPQATGSRHFLCAPTNMSVTNQTKKLNEHFTGGACNWTTMAWISPAKMLNYTKPQGNLFPDWFRTTSLANLESLARQLTSSVLNRLFEVFARCVWFVQKQISWVTINSLTASRPSQWTLHNHAAFLFSILQHKSRHSRTGTFPRLRLEVSVLSFPRLDIVRLLRPTHSNRYTSTNHRNISYSTGNSEGHTHSNDRNGTGKPCSYKTPWSVPGVWKNECSWVVPKRGYPITAKIRDICIKSGSFKGQHLHSCMLECVTGPNSIKRLQV